MKKSKKSMTDEEIIREFYESDRGEREYYESKINLKGKPGLDTQFKLPTTKDGCECLMEMVTTALDIPLTDQTRSIFAGWVHHIPQGTNTFTFNDLGKVMWRQKAIDATWLLDQDVKERKKLAREKEEQDAKEKENLTLATDQGIANTEETTAQ